MVAIAAAVFAEAYFGTDLPNAWFVVTLPAVVFVAAVLGGVRPAMLGFVLAVGALAAASLGVIWPGFAVPQAFSAGFLAGLAATTAMGAANA